MGEFLAVGVFLLLGLGAYWAFFLFPRQRDFHQRQAMARSLVEGDEVITGGGVVGRIRRIDGEKGVAYVEIAEGIQIRVLTAALIDRYDPEEIAKNANMGREAEAIE